MGPKPTGAPPKTAEALDALDALIDASPEEGARFMLRQITLRVGALVEAGEVGSFALAAELLSWAAHVASVDPDLVSKITRDEALEGEALVTIPAWWLAGFATGWEAWKAGPSGRSLGEALGVEGGGQGKPPAREALAKAQVDAQLGWAVLRARVRAEAAGAPTSLEKAIGEVATATGLGEKRVRTAWRAHGRAFEGRWRRAGARNAAREADDDEP